MNLNPCSHYKQNIEAYCCGHLSVEQTALLQDHLSTCEKCRHYCEALTAQDKQLTSWADSLDSWVTAGQDELLQKLRENTPLIEKPVERTDRSIKYRMVWNAIAASMLVAAGFFAARIFQPAVNQEKLFAEWSQTIRPQMEQKLAAAVARQLRPELLQVRNDLADKMTAQINESTAQSVAVSQALNAKLIKDFAAAIGTAQNRDRQLVAEAFSRMEELRLLDKKQTAKAVTTLALATGEEIARTRRQLSEVDPLPYDSSKTKP